MLVTTTQLSHESISFGYYVNNTPRLRQKPVYGKSANGQTGPEIGKDKIKYNVPNPRWEMRVYRIMRG